MVKAAAALKTKVDPSSNYRRIQRFIHDVRIDPKHLAPFLLRLAGLEAPYTLILDRTNWQFGKGKINFLMLSVKGEGWSIPLLWSLLPKKGNSTEQERIELLNRFLSIFGIDKIFNLVADREFIGDTWLSFLNEHRIPYDIRLRENLKVWHRGKLTHVFRLFRRLPLGEKKAIEKSVILGTTELYLQGSRIINSKTNKPEYLIIATYCEPFESSTRYAERWYIENMFKDMKSNGFQLECTHITKLERLDTLMGILSIAYVWMIKIGTWVRKMKPKRLVKKKHGRPAKSIFRAGLDEFINAIFSLDPVRLSRHLNFLSCT
ncbi:MAG: IS4 family transposase [Saprospiraceae bacterium]